MLHSTETSMALSFAQTTIGSNIISYALPMFDLPPVPPPLIREAAKLCEAAKDVVEMAENEVLKELNKAGIDKLPDINNPEDMMQTAVKFATSDYGQDVIKGVAEQALDFGAAALRKIRGEPKDSEGPQGSAPDKSEGPSPNSNHP